MFKVGWPPIFETLLYMHLWDADVDEMVSHSQLSSQLRFMT